jgi:hypothetical protein
MDAGLRPKGGDKNGVVTKIVCQWWTGRVSVHGGSMDCVRHLKPLKSGPLFFIPLSLKSVSKSARVLFFSRAGHQFTKI